MKRALLICLTLLTAAPAAAGTRRPVVVELFTSEGCSSCPPADDYLRELEKRGDVLPLSLHVDYWDNLGWKDTLGSKAVTTRQKAYNAAMKLRGIYTPQMVIDGVSEGIGSRRAEIAAKIEAREETLTAVPMQALRKGGTMSLKIDAGEQPASPATVWLVHYEKSEPVAMTRGENAGKTVTYVNAVRDMRSIGLWDGRAIELPLSGLGEGSYAALLQVAGTGPIIGATKIAR